MLFFCQKIGKTFTIWGRLLLEMWLQLQILRYFFVNGVYIIERIITKRNCALTHIHVILNTQLILLQILFFAYNNLGHHVKYGMTCKNLEAYYFLFIYCFETSHKFYYPNKVQYFKLFVFKIIFCYIYKIKKLIKPDMTDCFCSNK